MNNSELSMDDFVSEFGNGAVREAEEPTPSGDPATISEDVPTEEVADETQEATEELQAGEEPVEGDQDVEAVEEAEAEAEPSDEDGEVEVEAAEGSDDEDATEDQDDEDVQETSFQWDDSLEVEVPGIGKTTLEELRRNHLREADYTRKTQEIAEEKRRFASETEAKSKALDDERQLLTQRREALEATLNVLKTEMAENDPNWGELANEDQAEYIRQMELKRQRDERFKSIEAEVEAARVEAGKADEAKQAETEAQQNAYLREQAEKLFAALPDLRDDGKRQEAFRGYAEIVDQYGISPEEVFGVTDHRQVLLLEGFKQAQAEIASLKGEVRKARAKANKVEKAKPALKKKVQASSKRIKPVSSAPAEPKSKAAAFHEKIMKQNNGSKALTLDQYVQLEALERQERA